MRLRVQAEARPYIARLRGHGDWWLNELHRVAGGGAEKCTGKLNAALRRVAKREGWAVKEEDFSFYSARHTWASLARNVARVEKATIDECLTHKGDFALADIYIARSWDLLDEANRKVIDLLEW